LRIAGSAAGEKMRGGGKYGDAWRQMLEETRKVQMPGYAKPGFFYLTELAIGTHPKVFRPSNLLMRSSMGSFWERYRSGVVHVGVGTSGMSGVETGKLEDPEQGVRWWKERGLPWGHLHVHCMFPTYEVTTRTGEQLRVIDRGRLTALDDPEVRSYAARFGNVDELLTEDWVPAIPGVNVEGDYFEDYAKDPIPWIRKELTGEFYG